MDILTIISYCITGISLVITFVSVCVSLIKGLKSGSFKKTDLMYSLIPDLIVKAEQMFGKGNGVAKFDYVMTQLNLFALQNKIKFDTEKVKDRIENVVATTNQVNVAKPFPVEPKQTVVENHEEPVDNGQTNTETHQYF